MTKRSTKTVVRAGGPAKEQSSRVRRYQALADGYAALKMPQAEVYQDAAAVFADLAENEHFIDENDKGS